MPRSATGLVGRAGRIAARVRPDALGLIAGLVSGVLLFASFPPVGWYGCVVLVPAVLWGVALRSAIAGRRASRVGVGVWIGQVWVWAVWHWWLRDVSVPGMLGIVPYLSAYAGVFAFIAARVGTTMRRRPVVLAFGIAGLFFAIEYLRTEVVLTGYGFFLVGHPLIDLPGGLGAGLGSVVGAAGVSAWVALIGCHVGSVLAGPKRGRVAISLALVVASGAVVGLTAPVPPPSDERVRLGLVQTDVPQSVRGGWSAEARVQTLRSAIALSDEGVRRGAEVVVWPETMFPGFELNDQAAGALASSGLGLSMEDGAWVPLDLFRQELLAWQAGAGVAMVVGARAADGLRVVNDGGVSIEADARYNSAFVIDGGQVAGRYDKALLVPFGETVPYVSSMDWLESLVLSIGVGAEGMAFDLNAGRGPIALDVPGVGVVSTPICFEITEPGHVRAFHARSATFGADRSPGLAINLSNDGWFGDNDAGRDVHLLVSRWRAAENAVPVARSVNTGVSAMIDARGRVVDRLPAREAGVLVTDVTLASGAPTLFARGGHLVAHVSWIGAAVVVVASIRGGGRGRKEAGA